MVPLGAVLPVPGLPSFAEGVEAHPDIDIVVAKTTNAAPIPSDEDDFFRFFSLDMETSSLNLR